MSQRQESWWSVLVSAVTVSSAVGAGLLVYWAMRRRYFASAGELLAALQRGEPVARGVIGPANLQEVRLSAIRLDNAIVGFANFDESDLSSANLSGAVFGLCNLERADFTGAQLEGATFGLCNLEEARLSNANLRQAVLDLVNLRDADLTGADLQGARLKQITFDADTILPDGSRWSPERDLAAFTDVRHPAFWRSSDPASPAYRAAAHP